MSILNNLFDYPFDKGSFQKRFGSNSLKVYSSQRHKLVQVQDVTVSVLTKDYVLTAGHLGLEHDAGVAEGRHAPVLVPAGHAAPAVARLPAPPRPRPALVTCSRVDTSQQQPPR